MNNYIVTFLLFFSLSACCGTNKVVERPQEEKNEVAVLLDREALEIIEETQTIDNESQPLPIESTTDEMIEVVKTTEAFDHSIFNGLLKKHVSDRGNVNYNGFKKDISALRNYISSLGANTTTESWTKEDKLAYWINAYNALTIDLILRNPSIKSIKEIDDPWDQRLWKLGEKWYNLNEIEHDILRKMNEPRIHFAIVCASVSCPKLQNQAFTASDLETQLTNATKEFLNDPSKNKVMTNKLELSKIFKWFTKDFKQGQSLIDFLNKYSGIEISQKASISYKDYDWNLNE
jgi:hypothetical protein